MHNKIIYISLGIALLTSCNKENTIKETINNDTIKEVHYPAESIESLASKSTEDLMLRFEKEQKDLHDKLKTANRKEAEALYLDYYKRLTSIVDSLTLLENETLKNYHQLSKVQNDSILKKQETYDKLGIYFRKIDTNSYDFKLKPGFFYKIFKEKVSSDYNEFMKLRYEENLMTYESQFNNVEVNLEKQRDLVLRWEKFITKNKDFKFIDIAKKSYISNINSYLFGTLDKPSFQLAFKKLNVENEQEYIMFVKKNPKTISATITKEFLKHFYENDKNFTADAFYLNLREHTKKSIEDKLK